MLFKETLRENLQESNEDANKQNLNETFRRLLSLDINHASNLTLLKLFLMSNV